MTWTTDRLPPELYRNSWDNRFRTFPGRESITHLTDEEYRALYRKVFAVTAPENPSRVLDYGCGVGLVVPVIDELWPKAVYMGCDISPEMIRFCQSYIWMDRPDEAEEACFWLIPEDLELIKHWKFDFIICHSVFTHVTIADAQDLASLLFRLLETGGRASISIHVTEATQFFQGDWGKMEYNPATFENLLNDAGFKIRGFVDDIQRFYAVERVK